MEHMFGVVFKILKFIRFNLHFLWGVIHVQKMNYRIKIKIKRRNRSLTQFVTFTY